MWQEIKRSLDIITNNFKFPDKVVLESATGPEVIIKNKKVLMFGSYNYLGLANNQEIKNKTKEFIDKYGVGSGGVRLLTGTMDIHEYLENEIADLTDQEDAITIASGYGTNTGVIPGIVNLFGLSEIIGARQAVILCDEYNHASIVDGCKLTEAKIVKYLHCNVDDLNKNIRNYSNCRILIITDGIFSMDGDIAPLNDIIDIANKYDAMTMVDDAHAFGVIGKNGSGTANYLGRAGEIDLNMGTFSKGIGVSGGFVSGKKEIIKLLRASCKSYMFSDSLSPMVVGAVISTVKYIRDNPKLLSNIKEKSQYCHEQLKSSGFNILNSSTHIIPIVIGDSELTMRCSSDLLKNGVCIPAVRWPAVPKKIGRLRFVVTASHTYDHINHAISVLKEIGKKNGIIK